MVLFLSSRLEFRIHLCIGFLFLNGPWIFFAQRSKPWCSFLLFFRRMGWSDSPPKWLFKTSELAKSAVSLFVEPRLSTVFLVHDLRLRNRFTLCGGHRRAMSYRRRLFPFRKRSLPFLTVDAIIGNQAFCHGRCNICSGLSHNNVTNTFLNSLRKNKV